MYARHFGLTRRPFAATAEAECYYPATQQELAMARLRQALALEEGFALVTAEPGLGKTLLAHRLAEHFESSCTTVWITSTQLASAAALYQAMLFDLGRDYVGKSEQELRLETTACMLELFGTGRPVLVIIDEAHHLCPRVLEELRLLGNLESRQGKVVQVILLGLPSLLQTLATPELAALAQRIRCRTTLTPMDVHEAVDYLVHQIRAVGGRPETLVGDEALELLARASKGVPRLLNHVADRAFQLAANAGNASVDAEAVLEALDDLGMTAETADGPILAENAETGQPTPAAQVRPVQEMEPAGEGVHPRPRRLFFSSRRSA